MKHGKKILKIGRNASHRKATLQSMSAALLEHKRITTTFGKAKALRRFVEPVITHAKDDSTHSRRQAFRKLNDKEAVKRLYDEIAGVVGDRPGGYTRIVKLGQRAGDAAEMAVVELVDFNDVKPDGSTGTKRKTRRSRSRKRGNNTAPTVSAAAADTDAPGRARAAGRPRGRHGRDRDARRQRGLALADARRPGRRPGPAPRRRPPGRVAGRADPDRRARPGRRRREPRAEPRQPLGQRG